MSRKIVFVMIFMFFIGVLGTALEVQRVEAADPIYIRADGSIEPSTANITSLDNVTYTFTDNNYESIIIKRDNIVVDGAGYTLQGTRSGDGIDLSYRSNVTIMNVIVKSFAYGIRFYYSTYIAISENNVTKNVGDGVILSYSSYISIYKNNITENGNDGIAFYSGSNGSIYENNFVANKVDGVWLQDCTFSSAYRNYIAENVQTGISLATFDNNNNDIYENNVTKNGVGISACGKVNNVSANLIMHNKQLGIQLVGRGGYVLRNNIMVNNSLNFGVYGSDLTDFYNDVDASNTVNGKPVYYWVDRDNDVVPSDAGTVILTHCTNITVENLTLENNLQGVLLAYSHNITITRNNITKNGHMTFGGGIRLFGSLNNHIYENNVTGNYFYGIELEQSSCNAIYWNNVTKNSAAYLANVPGIRLLFCNISNTISENTISENNWNGVSVDYSSNTSIWANNINTNNYAEGVVIDAALHTSIYRNNIRNNKCGVHVSNSYYSSIYGNNIIENYDYGIRIEYSRDNTFYHNNLVDNAHQASIIGYGYANSWNNSYPSGGNYWSDYKNRYPNAVELDGSGTWDTPYVIDTNNTDNCPLMSPTQPITRVFTATDALQVTTYSNSSISSFQFNSSSKQLSFNVTGSTGTTGFCDVTIPDNLLWGEFSLYLNGSPLVKDMDYTQTYNGTHYTFHINYTHSTHTIEITGTEAIPEFPSALTLLLFMITTLIAVVFYRRKRACTKSLANA